jgi:hypothetical protein
MSNESHVLWQRRLAFGAGALALLAGLAAVRGPDAIGLGVAEAAGAWKLAGPQVWNPLTPLAVIAEAVFALAGPRGWQNAHVTIAWLALLFWLLPLPAGAWRGFSALIPALLAVVLSGPLAGLDGFGLAVTVLAVARWAAWRGAVRRQVALLVAGAWLAVWFSAGALPLVAAGLIGMLGVIPLRAWCLSAAGSLLVCHLTPRGFGVWGEMSRFLLWSPQPQLSPPAVLALLSCLIVCGVALRATLSKKNLPLALSPALLFLGAAAGQHAYLWAAALALIPCWVTGKDLVAQMGWNIRWWMQMSMVIGAAALVAWQGFISLPRWYGLAMTDAVVRPTLTRDAVTSVSGPVYVNPQGRALARFGGPLPDGSSEPGSLQLAREAALWRAHDRRERFAAVWLLGEKSDYAPLARHLGESPDWRLAAVDATGLLFVRGARDEEFATEPAQEMARGMWGGANRSAFLGGSALSCLAANAIPEADELSQAALRNGDRSSAAAATRARVLVSTGDIKQAVNLADRAVALEPASDYAWQVRAETLLHAGRTDDAYAAGQRAAELAPGDAGALWLAARTANAARAFQTEAGILERLVALTQGRGMDASFYQLYLGQSYAKQGLERPALRAFDEAARSPTLTPEQRKELEEEIARIKSPDRAP